MSLSLLLSLLPLPSLLFIFLLLLLDFYTSYAPPSGQNKRTIFHRKRDKKSQHDNPLRSLRHFNRLNQSHFIVAYSKKYIKKRCIIPGVGKLFNSHTINSFNREKESVFTAYFFGASHPATVSALAPFVRPLSGQQKVLDKHPTYYIPCPTLVTYVGRVITVDMKSFWVHCCS